MTTEVIPTSISTFTATPIAIPALEGKQNGHRLFIAFMSAKDLVAKAIADPYNSALAVDDVKQGYQRPPERSRITKIGNHLIDSILNGEGNTGGLFPTAAILASREPLIFSNGKLTIKSPLQIIDGQHRINGMKYAYLEKNKEELAEFPLPCIIIETADRITEMNQFNIINGNAKSVRTDLVNSILTATAAKKGDAAINDKDRWKVVVTKVVSRLNQDPHSPWHALIAMPDESGSPKGGEKVVRATSVMTSLRPVYNWLKELGSLASAQTIQEETDELYKVLLPFWQAIKQVVPKSFDHPSEYVIQKTPGLFSLHYLLSRDLLRRMHLAFIDTTTASGFVHILQHSPELTDENFWNKNAGRASAYGSMKGFDDLYKLLADSLKP